MIGRLSLNVFFPNTMHLHRPYVPHKHLTAVILFSDDESQNFAHLTEEESKNRVPINFYKQFNE